MQVTYTTSVNELKEFNSCHNRDNDVERGFIGLDDKHHAYEYDKTDYSWHSHMTNEEWLEKNDLKQLAACQKCSMWKHCRKSEHTILTENGVKDKLTDGLTHEINKQILKDMKL